MCSLAIERVLNLPQISAELLVVLGLVRAPVGLEDLGLEVVLLLHLRQEGHGLVEEVEAVEIENVFCCYRMCSLLL